MGKYKVITFYWYTDFYTINLLPIAFFLMGDAGPSEFYVLIFRNTLSISSRLFFLLGPRMKMGQSFPKRRYTKFRGRGITQKKEYNIKNMAKVWKEISFTSGWYFILCRGISGQWVSWFSAERLPRVRKRVTYWSFRMGIFYSFYYF
jgi:hypothetical protein